MGLDRFFVHYWTASQVRVYQEYCKLGESKISIDATGSLVQKLRRPNNQRSGHVFLYEGVASLPGNPSSQTSVVQMLSERHNANAIHYWLSEWLKSVPRPKEVVCDFSVALLNGIIRSFSNSRNITEYVEASYMLLTNSEKTPPPSCFIRVDVAHCINIICKWDCFRGRAKRLKDFYVRMVAQVIQSQSLDDVKHLLVSILVIAQCETEGCSSSTESLISSTVFKDWAMKTLARNPTASNITNVTEENEEQKLSTRNQKTEETEEEECTPSPSFDIWLREISDYSKGRTLLDDGINLNPHYLPGIVRPLLELCQTLPLWSAVMLPVYKYGNITATSAPVESEFNELKTRILNNKHPIRVDEFLTTHLNILEGGVRIAAASINRTVAEPNVCHEPCDDSTNNDDLASECKRTTNETEHRQDDEGREENQTNEKESDTGNEKDNILEPVDLCEEDEDVEDWKGMITQSKKRRSLYLTPSENLGYSATDTKVGILRNGSCSSLKVIKRKLYSWIRFMAARSVRYIHIETHFQIEILIESQTRGLPHIYIIYFRTHGTFMRFAYSLRYGC